MSSNKFNPFKDFQSDQIQGSSRKIFTPHCTCRNANLILTIVTGMINGFIFQIFNSLIESWGGSLDLPLLQREFEIATRSSYKYSMWHRTDV